MSSSNHPHPETTMSDQMYNAQDFKFVNNKGYLLMGLDVKDPSFQDVLRAASKETSPVSLTNTYLDLLLTNLQAAIIERYRGFSHELVFDRIIDGENTKFYINGKDMTVSSCEDLDHMVLQVAKQTPAYAQFLFDNLFADSDNQDGVTYPDDFDGWGVAINDSGWTLAHHAVKHQVLPYNFNWDKFGDLSDSNGLTVEALAIEKGYIYYE